ncbi:MAG: hypothetical protein OEY63_07355 [Gemmatimonadota bacterium]|nr:hypothetical protein [Gemmatimonadota bacterium]
MFANLKAGKYASLRDLAEKNYRHGLWASWFVDVIVAERKLLTLEEFAACLTSPRAQKMLLARHKLPVPPPPPPTPEHTVKPKRKRGGDRFDEEKWMAKLQKVCPKIAKKIMEEEESSTL